MVGPAPQLKSAELANRINALERSRKESKSLDEWVWRSLMRDVERLESSAPDQAGIASLLKATLWGFRMDIDRMEACFSKYAALFGKDWLWHRVRGTQGPSVGRLNMVVDMLKFGYPEGDPDAIGDVAAAFNQSGLFVSARNALARLQGLSPHALSAIHNVGYEHLPMTVAYLDQNGIEELEIAKRIEVASRVVIDMTGTLTKFWIVSNEYGITFEYSVDAVIERLVDIDMAISEALTAQFDDTLSNHLSLGVYQAEGFDQNAS